MLMRGSWLLATACREVQEAGGEEAASITMGGGYAGVVVDFSSK